MKKKWLTAGIVVAAMAMLAMVLGFGVNGYVLLSTRNAIQTPEQAGEFDADCILVLGCLVREDGSPSNMLHDRLQCGVELYQAGASGKILMSGDHGQESYDEVNAMKRFALEAGVPSEDVFMDHAGFSTYESIYRAKEIFGAKKVIIVTQKYHLYRALYIAKSLGLEAVGVAADSRSYTNQIYRELREILARNKDFLTSIFKPEPTCLGDMIPISGNGDDTNDPI